MNRSAVSLSIRTVVVAAGFACVTLHAQNETEPVGFVRRTVGGSQTTSFSLPLQNETVFSGSSSAVSSNTINVVGANWTPGQFATANSPFIVSIAGGAQIGRSLLVTSNTEDTLTVDVGDTVLNASGYSVLPGDKVEVYPGDTLAGTFGSAVDANGSLPSGLKGDSLVFRADSVQVYNGVVWKTCYFNSSLGYWVMYGGGNVNQNNLVLYPDQGLMIARRSSVGVTMTITGKVPMSTLATQFKGGTTRAVGPRFPVDMTLGALTFGGPGSWITGASSEEADTIGIWNGIRFRPYFKDMNNHWLMVDGDGSDQSGVAIPIGSSFLVYKRGTATGPASFYSHSLPYPQ